jgi:nucleolar complex protein 2
MRAYLKVLLELWSSAPKASVRIAAFLAVRRMFEGGDDAIKDQCLKVSLEV